MSLSGSLPLKMILMFTRSLIRFTSLTADRYRAKKLTKSKCLSEFCSPYDKHPSITRGSYINRFQALFTPKAQKMDSRQFILIKIISQITFDSFVMIM